MAAPDLTFTVSGTVLSAQKGYDAITVTFSPDIACTAFECRATPLGAAYGRGVGTLVASFAATPAGVTRSFEIYDEYLTAGDGDYRISLYAQGQDGSWNDNCAFVPGGADGLLTHDGKHFLCMR